MVYNETTFLNLQAGKKMKTHGLALLSIPAAACSFSGLLLLAALFSMLMPGESCGSMNTTDNKTLILYYSRTGNTRMVCEALQQALGADIMEVKDLSNRKGGWGFFTGTLNSLFNMKTGIAPAQPDMSAYANIILASPIWAGKLAPAIRTLIAKNRLDGKRVILFTTTNVLEKEKYKEKSKALAVKAGGQALAHYQVAVKEKVNGEKKDKDREQIVREALAVVPDIQKALAQAH
jgi:flavodoxin